MLFSLLFASGAKQFATHRFRVEKISDWLLVGMSNGYKGMKRFASHPARGEKEMTGHFLFSLLLTEGGETVRSLLG